MSFPTITYDGVDFYATYGFILGKQSYPFATDPKLPLIEGAWRDGGFINTPFSQARRQVISGKVANTAGVTDAIDKLDMMTRALNQKETKALRISTVPDREWQALRSSSLDVRWVGSEPFISFEMLAPDPRSIDTGGVQSVNATSGSPISVASGVTGGSAFADAVFIIDPGSHLVGDKYVENVTTGDRVDILDLGASNENSASFRVAVNTVLKIIEISTDGGGTYSPANEFLKSVVAFPQVEPGVDNTFRAVGFAGGSRLDVFWNETYA